MDRREFMLALGAAGFIPWLGDPGAELPLVASEEEAGGFWIEVAGHRFQPLSIESFIENVEVTDPDSPREAPPSLQIAAKADDVADVARRAHGPVRLSFSYGPDRDFVTTGWVRSAKDDGVQGVIVFKAIEPVAVV